MLNQSGKIKASSLILMLGGLLGLGSVLALSSSAQNAPVAARMFYAATPTGTTTPGAAPIWLPYGGSPSGSSSGGQTVIVNGGNISSNGYVNNNPSGTPTWVPLTTAATNPAELNFYADTTSNAATTLVTATSGSYNNIRGFTIVNTSASSGSFYITDGSVTLFGPMTLPTLSGHAPPRRISGRATNRPIVFFNSGGVSDLIICGEYSVDSVPIQ